MIHLPVIFLQFEKVKKKLIQHCLPVYIYRGGGKVEVDLTIIDLARRNAL